MTFVAEKILTTCGRFRLRAQAVQVLTVAPGGIARLDIFLDPGLFRVFGLPPQLGEPVAAGAASSWPGAGLSG